MAAVPHMQLIDVSQGPTGANTMHSLLALGLLIALAASANAATVHLHIPQHVIVRPGPRLSAPERFAVPGWTDEATRRWLDNASAGWKQA